MDDAVLSIECLARLGLGKQPFTSSTQDFIYSDPALDMPINVILGHLGDRITPLLVKGEQGIGKTTLLQRLQAKLPPDVHFCPIESGVDISMAAIDYCIRLQWQPRPAHGDPRKLSIDRYLFALMHDDLHPVLVLDDAHLLEPQVLAGLLQLKSDMKSEYGEDLGLVMLGEPSIEAKLNQISANSPLISKLYTVALRPLNRDQIRAYLEHRLRAAGAARAEVSDEEVIAVQSASGGLPGRLNQAACQVLEARCGGRALGRLGDGNRWQGRLLVPATLGVVVVGLIAVLVGLLDGVFDSPESNQPLEEIALTLPPPEPPPLPDTSLEEISPPPEPVTALEGEPVPMQPERSQTATSIDQPPAISSSPRPAPRSPEPEPPAEDAVSTSPQSATESTDLQGPDWLARQDPDHFTVQILGVGSEAALKRYYAAHKFSEPMAYYRTERGGETWFVLLAGIYPDSDSARKAIASFPLEIRQNQPWIRRIGDLQAASKPQ